jgi:hypothetical protein
MSTMSPWFCADVAAGTGGGTGPVMFDVPGDLELGLFDDPTDPTPLNFDDIPNIGLGAVLKHWDDTLNGSCRLRVQAGRLSDVDVLVPLHGAEVRASRDLGDDSAEDGPALGVVAQIAQQTKSALKGSLLAKLQKADLGVLTRDRGVMSDADEDVLDLSRSLGRVKTGPVASSGSYRRQFWVMLTGDEALDLRLATAEEANEAEAGAEADAAEETESTSDRFSAVEMIEHLQDTLQVPAETVLRAAGINRRTYHHWKQTGATPRLASQARLWDLVLTVRGWEDELGDDLAAWIRQPDRLDLLEIGAFDDLTNQVLSHQLRLIEPSERRYRDRFAAGYFESVDREFAESEQPTEEASSGNSTGSSERPVRLARRARRASSPGRSST